jgi:hypothetical protein
MNLNTDWIVAALLLTLIFAVLFLGAEIVAVHREQLDSGPPEDEPGPPDDEEEEDEDEEEEDCDCGDCEDEEDEEEEEEDDDDDDDDEEEEVVVVAPSVRGSIVISGGSQLSNISAAGGRIRVGSATVRNSESVIGGARIIDDHEGTRVILDEGTHFQAVVNGIAIDAEAPMGGGRRTIQLTPGRGYR